jgi:hypothetical protein
MSKRKNVWQASHSLSDEEYTLLGFEKKPTYEMLREFIYERIGINQFIVLFRCVVKNLITYLKQKGIAIGEETFQDATNKHSLKHDPEAKYSGYYKHSGYKMDTTIDANLLCPLDYVPMEIAEDEGKNLISSVKQVQTYGLEEKIRVIDCKYATFENIAYCELQGIQLYYKIADHWIYKEEGEPGQSNSCINDIIGVLILIKYSGICIEKKKQKQLVPIFGIFVCLNMRSILKRIWRFVILEVVLKGSMVD